MACRAKRLKAAVGAAIVAMVTVAGCSSAPRAPGGPALAPHARHLPRTSHRIQTTCARFTQTHQPSPAPACGPLTAGALTFQ